MQWVNAPRSFSCKSSSLDFDVRSAATHSSASRCEMQAKAIILPALQLYSSVTMSTVCIVWSRGPICFVDARPQHIVGVCVSYYLPPVLSKTLQRGPRCRHRDCGHLLPLPYYPLAACTPLPSRPTSCRCASIPRLAGAVAQLSARRVTEVSDSRVRVFITAVIRSMAEEQDLFINRHISRICQRFFIFFPKYRLP